MFCSFQRYLITVKQFVSNSYFIFDPVIIEQGFLIMKRFQNVLAISTFSILAATSFHGPAWAVDANAFTKRLQENLKQDGWTLSTSKSETDGNDIVLHDIDLSINPTKHAQPDKKESTRSPDQTSPQEKPFAFEKIEELRFKNVTEDKDGNYLAENLTIPALTSENENFRFFVEDINFSNIKFAPNTTTTPLVRYFPYESMTIGQMYSTHDNQMFLTLDGLVARYTPQTDKKLMDITVGINSFDYEPEKTGVPDAGKWLNIVGYNNITGSFQSHGLWDLENGKYTGDKNEIVINNAGKLNLSLNLEGVSEDVVQNIATLRKNVFANDRDEKAFLVGYLGIIQQIKFGGMKISYDDNSLTNRILDYFAKQNGVTRADFINQLKATLPLIGTKIDHPEFVKNTSDQLGMFLDNPKSITISTAPDKAVSLPILMATGNASPAQLIDLLNAKVMANK